MFSGGVDSTMAALTLAERFEQVDLLTFHNGYGHYRIERTGERARELNRHAPNVFRHSIVSVQSDFERFVIDHLEEEYARYGSGFVWCLGCKLAMHMRTIMHCRTEGITVAADGSSLDTAEMVEQMPVSVEKIRAFYREYGIDFENPVYRHKRADSIVALRAKGFRMGVRIGDRFLGIQPKCKPGELYYLPYLLLGTPPDHREEKVAAFIDDKLAVARQIIAALPTEHGEAE